MTILGFTIIVAAIVFIREELLSAMYRKQIREAQNEYFASCKEKEEKEQACLPFAAKKALCEGKQREFF